MKSFRVLGAAVAAAMLSCTATPAAAQQFSEGYQFLEALRKEDGTKVMEILNKPGTQIVNTRDRSTGEGALHIVTRKQSDIYLRFLLQRDANPNIQDGEGNSPMMVAVGQGYLEGVQILITYKGNVNLRNSKGETPLIRAVQLRNLQLVRLLLDSGANPDQVDVIAGMSARDYAKADARMPAAIVKAIDEAKKVDRKGAMGPKL
jgi:ankyrin repeat protein